MNIIFNEQTKEFHIFNNNISYVIKVLRNGHTPYGGFRRVCCVQAVRRVPFPRGW